MVLRDSLIQNLPNLKSIDGEILDAVDDCFQSDSESDDEDTDAIGWLYFAQSRITLLYIAHLVLLYIQSSSLLILH